jgi:beta-ribofuranosylaminobenzene 5'-phosphate synthase
LASRVRVVAGSRLHAGFYYAGPGRPYRWGSAGFYVEEPRVVVEAEECPDERGTSVEAAPAHAPVLESVLKKLGVRGVCARLLEAPPRHAGLGSTTQITLATACAVSILRGASTCSPGEVAALARRLGRARVSGAGTLLYALGGFVADAGSPDPSGPRPLMRHGVPGGWRFIIVLPRLERGLTEDEERPLLVNPQPPGAAAERLMARGLLRLAAGVARGDLTEALEGLRELQLGTGMYFSHLQGGAYRRDLQGIAGEAQRNGVFLAQSSWGPALYTITTSEDAWGDAALLQSILGELGVEGRVIVAGPRNRGASWEAYE